MSTVTTVSPAEGAEIGDTLITRDDTLAPIVSIDRDEAGNVTFYTGVWNNSRGHWFAHGEQVNYIENER